MSRGQLMDTLECQQCGTPVLDLYEPVTAILIGTVLCPPCNGASVGRVEGCHFWSPSDTRFTGPATVPRDFP